MSGRSIKKSLSLLLCLCMAMMAMNVTAFAASNTKITSIALTIDSEINVGDSASAVDVSTSSSEYDVDSVEVTNTPSGEWEDGDKPKLKITLVADDDYYFPSSGLSKSNVTLSGSSGSVTSISRSSSSKLYVYVTLSALDDSNVTYDLDITDLEWNSDNGSVSWSAGDDAKSFELRLYRGSTLVASSLTTSNTYYNFSSYLTRSGEYTARVRAVYSSSKKGSWTESDVLDISSSEAEHLSGQSNSQSGGSTSSGTAAWVQDNVGWWYRHADGGYTTSNWEYINGEWYYFNPSGYMVVGWIDLGGTWYYLSSSGAMLHDTYTPDGYYVNSSGAWQR